MIKSGNRETDTSQFLDIREFRKKLHANPELSGIETETARAIQAFFESIQGYEILPQFGFESFIALKRFGEGPKIAFRAELDALPIQENSRSDYQSSNKGIAHLCGHDGHMSTLLRLAQKLETKEGIRGTVVFIFQSAEETGEGAAAMVEDDRLENLEIEHCFALHNIPGKSMGRILYRKGPFACASVGAKIQIQGKSAHAAHPEEGLSAIKFAAAALKEISRLDSDKGFTLITPVHLNSGEKAFGSIPDFAELWLTLRAESTEILDFLMESLKELMDDLVANWGTQYAIDFAEYFPSTNNAREIESLSEIANLLKLEYTEMEKPFRWSEDFGHFSNLFPITMFGLGSGVETAPLHAPNYDFPDDLIETGSDIFLHLYMQNQSKGG